MYVGNSGEFIWVRIGFILSTLFLTVAVILASARPPQAPQKNQIHRFPCVCGVP